MPLELDRAARTWAVRDTVGWTSTPLMMVMLSWKEVNTESSQYESICDTRGESPSLPGASVCISQINLLPGASGYTSTSGRSTCCPGLLITSVPMADQPAARGFWLHQYPWQINLLPGASDYISTPGRSTCCQGLLTTSVPLADQPAARGFWLHQYPWQINLLPGASDYISTPGRSTCCQGLLTTSVPLADQPAARGFWLHQYPCQINLLKHWFFSCCVSQWIASSNLQGWHMETEF